MILEKISRLLTLRALQALQNLTEARNQARTRPSETRGKTLAGLAEMIHVISQP